MPVDQLKDDLIQQQILQAAQQLFQQHGFGKVTMDDVARAIGKGRSSLYYYYKSKHEVLEAVMDAEIEGMLGAMEQATDKAENTEQKIYAFCITKLQFVQKRRVFYSMLDLGVDAAEMSNYNKSKLAIHARIIKLEGILLGKILDGGIQNGELRVMDPKQREVLIFVLLSSLHGLKREMAMENNFDGIKPAVDTLTQMTMYGIKV